MRVVNNNRIRNIIIYSIACVLEVIVSYKRTDNLCKTSYSVSNLSYVRP